MRRQFRQILDDLIMCGLRAAFAVLAFVCIISILGGILQALNFARMVYAG